MFTDGISRFSTANTPPADEMNEIREPESAQSNPLDDVFGGDSDDDHASDAYIRTHREHPQLRNQHVSDVPRLQGIHTTNGYRDGIAASKEKFLQEGFDEGYSLGAEIGAAAGRLIGVLEGLLVAVLAHAAASDVPVRLEDARRELSAKSLYAPEYFGEDGIWKYDIGESRETEEDVTFRVVAAAHPVIAKWTRIADEVVAKHGLQIKPF
jgi:hypothetical protein